MKKTAILLILLLNSLAFSQFLAPQQKPMLGLQINKAHPLGDPVAFYLGNEGSGNLVQDLSGGNTGTFVGNPLWIPGETGHAIDFSDDAINCGGNVYNNCTTGLTIICKFKWGGAGATYGRLCDKYPGPSPYLYVDSVEMGFYGEIGGVSRDDQWTTAKPVLGEQDIWAFRLGSGFQECYKNGVLADATLSSGPYAGAYDIGSGVDFYIGNRASDMARDIDGAFEFFYVYNRALSSSEIALLYREPFCMVGGGMSVAQMYSYAAAGVTIPVFMFHYMNH